MVPVRKMKMRPFHLSFFSYRVGGALHLGKEITQNQRYRPLHYDASWQRGIVTDCSSAAVGGAAVSLWHTSW